MKPSVLLAALLLAACGTSETSPRDESVTDPVTTEVSASESESTEEPDESGSEQGTETSEPEEPRDDVFVTAHGTYQWSIPSGVTIIEYGTQDAPLYRNGEPNAVYRIDGPAGMGGGIEINPGVLGELIPVDRSELIDEMEIRTPSDEPVYVRSELVTDCEGNDCPVRLEFSMTTGQRGELGVFRDVRQGEDYGVVTVWVTLPEEGTTESDARALIDSPEYALVWSMLTSFTVLT